MTFWRGSCRRWRLGSGIALGDPTPAQRLGWPAIAAGRNTLIVAPTGSGKTLAAFLAALDLLWRTPRREAGVRILYVSPLKALNEDIRRNLEVPLAGILERSRECGPPLSPLQVAVRSGDTPARDRARLVRKPPDILITTPESLHLMLTSRAREILRGVSHVIIDEIHAVCGNKRGVFLALLLERLEAISQASFLRVGLSATQRPLEEVARYLGGQRCVAAAPGERRFEARPVTIIDAGRRKTMDLQVLWPGPDEGRFLGPPGTIWPAIEERIVGLIDGHRSTIVFTNNRRTVEKLTGRLNEAVAAAGPIEPSRARLRRPGPSRLVPGPPRQPEPRGAPRHRRRAQERRTEGRGVDGLARARHRHGRGRPGLPGGVAGQHRPRLAEGGPGRSRGSRRQQGPADRQDGERSAGDGCPGPCHGRGEHRAVARAPWLS